METNYERIIFHIDVNSAFLSWEAARRLAVNPDDIDIRNIPSVIGGDREKRRGIVLAKSVPAKQCGIVTGETLYSALQKCPNLTVVTPKYNEYVKASNDFVDLLKNYTPNVEQYSVDECFLDMSNVRRCREDPKRFADEIRTRINRELGFTVNVGVSDCKLLAKVASELKKPNMTHTLYPNEIKEKMWPLKIEDMFMIGRSTALTLKSMGVSTVGDLAELDKETLLGKFKTVKGNMLYNYARGIDNSKVKREDAREKSISSSATLPADVKTSRDALRAILYICEILSEKMRKKQFVCMGVTLFYKTSDFYSVSSGVKLSYPAVTTNELFESAKKIFMTIWSKEAIRQVGVCVTDLIGMSFMQKSFFDSKERERNVKIDFALDGIREHYGKEAVKRGAFIDGGYSLMRGIDPAEGEFPSMNSNL